MSEISDLRRCTSEFFQLHWPAACGDAPTWQQWPPPFQGPVPNYNLRGCYALSVGRQIVYIGLGVRKSGGYLKDHGISIRLLGHVVGPNPDGTHSLREKWSDVSDIYTIGFEGSRAYLAPALELYLIEVLHPPRNSTHVQQ